MEFFCKFINDFAILLNKNKQCLNFRWIFIYLLIVGISSMGYAQKNKDIIPTIDCIKYTGNGLYQASFGYENPTNKEVIIDENGSIIKSNNGKRIAKGLNKFKPGPNNKVFTKEFSANDFVEWTIISNGNEHTIVVNANGAKCAPDDGFIFPVIGNGKSFDLIGQELTALCDNVTGETPSDLIFQIKEEKVLVEIVPIAGKMNEVIDLLKGIDPVTMSCNNLSSPFTIPDTDFLLYDPDKTIKEVLDGLTAIDVYIEKDLICNLNDYACIINFARPVYPAIKNSFGAMSTGNAISQGDASQGSDVVRESFRLIDAVGNVLPVDGTGITIGVMSNSFDTQTSSSGNLSRATVDVQQGDLPGTGDIPENDNPNGYLTNVDILKEYPFEALGPASDEGRAMMHIIHDVAPGAALAFHTGSLSPRNFEVGFKALAGFNEDNEVIDPDLGLKSNIIVDDITFITEPFFRDGRIAESIKEFSTAGGIHFTSAGNFADHGYQSTFSASSTVPTTNFIDPSSETKAHLFDGTGDYLQKFRVVPGTYLIALQWKELVASQDNSTGADSDLDIYIVDDLGRLLVGSNRVNSDFVNSDGSVDGNKGDPTEIIVFRATGTGEANILITSANGATNVPFRFIAFQSDGLTLMEYEEGAPTISGHAMTEESVTVGAIRYNKTEPEIFSSYGGTLSDNITSVEVDLAAPDGVDTNVISIGSKYFSNGVPVDDTPLYPNFFGTSASAPSAAAAVALLQSALPTWYPKAGEPGKSSKSASEVLNLFKTNVKDGSLPDDAQAGAGMIDANKVFNSLAAQTGRITSFEFVPETDSENASINTVTIKIIGEFLPVPDDGQTYETDPLVYLDGEPVPYTLTDGVIYAEIPPFSGNPVLQVYTEPKEGSEGNGGFSEPYSFFQDGKTVLTVTANPPDTINEDGSITQNPVTVKFGEEYKSKLTYTVEGLELLENETYAQALERLGFPVVGLSTVVDNSDYPDVNNYTVTPNFEGDFPDSDSDGVPDVYDQCPVTPDGVTVDENGCSDDQKEVDDFTPATTYKVNFIAGNLAIEKNNLIITPKDVIAATYGDKITVELEYSGYGITNDVGDETFDLINDPEAFLNKIKAEHLMDFYSTADGITPVGLINNFKPGSALDPEGVDRYQDILDLLEHGSWISSENTFINRVEQVPYKGGSYPENEGYPERIYGEPGSGFINFNPLDFTAYLEYFDTPDETIENGKVLGIINGQRLGIINGQRLGIVNGKVLGIINGRVLGIINGQRLGIVNDELTGVVNGQRLGIINDSSLGSGSDTNDYNQVFSIIDTSDFSQECVDDESCAISKFHALNLITGVEVTNGVSQYIFPGTFINTMSDNFNITYQKAELAVAKKDIMVETTALPVPYGGDISTVITTEFDYAYDDNTENVFPDGIPYYFKKDGGDDTEYTIGGPIKMNVGTYNIYIRDVADNYNVKYGTDHGQLTITEATLTVDTTTADNIEYGGTPNITTVISGFPYNDDNDQDNNEGISTLFPENEGGIPYFFMKQGETPECDTCTKYYLPYIEGADKMVVDVVYDIFITDSPDDNYKIEFAAERGTLTVDPKELFPETAYHEAVYGTFDASNLSTVFGFAYGELEVDVYSDGVPYTFTKDGITYDKTDRLDVGYYDIQIGSADNYIINIYGTNHSSLNITPADLSVTISPDNLIIDQGDIPGLTASFGPFAYDDENEFNVFPTDGIPYYFEDEYGDKVYDTSVPGAFTVRIEDPTNYVIAENEAKLFINSDDIIKIRTYADCVAYDPTASDGLFYTVVYRYENDNFDPVYVSEGADNNLSGPAQYGGQLPTTFLPGSGIFEIRFDGKKLVWSLTTDGITQKSSVSSANQSGTGECDAKLDGSYTLAPNPVTSSVGYELSITNNIMEESDVFVYNMYGSLVITGPSFNGTIGEIQQVYMGDQPNGLYIVQIVSATNVRTYNILKQ